jgi:hypothetical protein
MAIWYVDNSHKGWLKGLLADGSTFVNDADLVVTFETIAGTAIAGPFPLTYVPASNGDYSVDLEQADVMLTARKHYVAHVVGTTPQGWNIDIREPVRAMYRSGTEGP